jgi:His/Glu/Gln/Arg/opine family amino acid ABC transporter permease subunit
MAAIPESSGRASVGSLPIPAFLRDTRVLSVVGQILFAAVLVYALSLLWGSILVNLERNGLTPNLNFLSNRAGFDIGERPEWYTSNSSYGEAFTVGLINTLRIVTVGLVLTTIIGILGGIFLLSNNWLLRNVTRGIVELLRNTPILLQLIFWYTVAVAALPDARTPLTLLPEGRYFIPTRWLIFAGLIAFIWFGHLRQRKPGTPGRLFWLMALSGGVLAFEIGLLLFPAVYGTGQTNLTTLLVYGIISLILIITADNLLRGNPTLRWRAIGLTVGQLVGGLLLFFAVLPGDGIPFELYPSVYIGRRGVILPEIYATARFGDWLAFVAVGVALALILWIYFGRLIEQTGRPYPRLLFVIVAIGVFTLIGWFAVSLEPTPPTVPVTQDGATSLMPIAEARAAGLLTTQDEILYSSSPILYLTPQPRLNNSTGLPTGNYTRGTSISPEYVALLFGLVIYTSAFVAEIVRAGILAVPKGQIEASRALGFNTAQTLRMVILPQAMRVIIPPLASQYLNLAKNSSLAIAVAFADIVMVTQTIMNQSGQSVTGIVMIMLTYLTMSLIISLFTNIANRRFQLVTR